MAAKKSKPATAAGKPAAAPAPVTAPVHAMAPAQAPSASTPPRRNELRAGAGGRTVHDVGGLNFGAIDHHEHDLALWEKRVDAIAILLVGRKAAAYSLDAKRRVIEDYGEQAYDSTTYYEKWIRSIRNLMVEQDIATPAEIEAKMADVRARMKSAGRAASEAAISYEAHHQGVPAARPAAKAKAAAKAEAKPSRSKPRKGDR